MHFIFCDLTFGVFERFWDFSKLMRFLQNFWVGCCLNDLKCSCIASHLDFNNVSCILDVCLLCFMILNTSRSIENHGFLYRDLAQFFSHFSRSLLTLSDSSPPQTPFSHSKPLPHSIFSLKVDFFL